MRNIVIFVLLLLSCNASGAFQESPGQNTGPYKLKSWGYEYSGNINKPRYLSKTLPGLDVLSFTGYKLDAKGRLRYRGRSRKVVEQAAQKYKIPQMPLISLKNVRVGKRLLRNLTARTRAHRELTALLKTKNYRGLHIDFEYLPPEYASDFARFLKELRSVMSRKTPGKKLTAAIFPPIGFPKKIAGFHNLKLLSPHLDSIVLMCYDLHRPGTEPGPVTDLDWTEKNIKEALGYLSPQKLWLGIPAYGYRWESHAGKPKARRKIGKTKAISAKNGIKQARRYRANRHSSGTLHYRYRHKDKLFQVYLSDTKTRQKMKTIAKRYKLRGTALWRLGFEE